MKKTKRLSALSLRVVGVVAEISCKSEQNSGLILYRFIAAVAGLSWSWSGPISAIVETTV